MDYRIAVSILAVIGILIWSPTTWSQDDPTLPEDPAHDEIRALRDGALGAHRDKDIDKLLTYLHPNVVVTLQNGEVYRGHQEVRAFHDRMSVGDDREVQSVSTEFTVDELSILHGADTAVAFGSMDDDFELKGGMKFSLHSRWTATLVKEDDRWSVAAFNASTNMFDNGVSRLLLWWNTVKVGATCGGIGLLVGGLVMVLFCRKRGG